MTSERRVPKVPLDRRSYAFGIDFLTVFLISFPFKAATVGISISQLIVFVLAWLGLRVILVTKNQGQSLGRWAMDLKVVDAKFRKTPGLFELSKREGTLGCFALLAVIGLEIGLWNGISLLLLASPLGVDCGLAFSDTQLRQALHDRIANTLVVPTRRGYSLDLRAKRFLTQFRRLRRED